jgi:hypothetical protein
MDNDTHESSSGPVRPEPSPGRAAPDGVARVSRAPTVPEDIRPLLASAWLLEGEDPGLFEMLLAKVGDAIRPIDIIDWIYVMDVVVLTWKIQRSRRHCASRMRVERRSAMEQFSPSYCRAARHSPLTFSTKLKPAGCGLNGSTATKRRSNGSNNCSSRRAYR